MLAAVYMSTTAPDTLRPPPGTSTSASDGNSSAATTAGHPRGREEYSAPSVPLKLVVADAVKRWFEDTYQDAQRGDVKQQALLAQMYAEGYGCDRNLRAAKEWSEKASSKGYHMRGVYCEL